MTQSPIRSFLALALAGSLTLGVAPLDARDSQVAERLMRSRDVELYTVKIPGSPMEAGAARIHVAAPLQAATRVATDFGRYSKFISQFEQSRIVGKRAQQTDVYLRVPILKGAAKVWAVMRFEAPRQVSANEYVMTGKMVRGNVQRFETTYRFTRIDEQNTLLHLEMLIVPRLPFPGAAVTAEVSKACRSAVRQLRRAAEGTLPRDQT